jgi:CubicO group peptidase (beta-lactamase class C family)
MVTPGTLLNGSITGYGYGLFIDSYRGNVEWTHAGGVHGFNAVIVILPRRRFVMAVLANVWTHGRRTGG